METRKPNWRFRSINRRSLSVQTVTYQWEVQPDFTTIKDQSTGWTKTETKFFFKFKVESSLSRIRVRTHFLITVTPVDFAHTRYPSPSLQGTRRLLLYKTYIRKPSQTSFLPLCSWILKCRSTHWMSTNSLVTQGSWLRMRRLLRDDRWSSLVVTAHGGRSLKQDRQSKWVLLYTLNLESVLLLYEGTFGQKTTRTVSLPRQRGGYHRKENVVDCVKLGTVLTCHLKLDFFDYLFRKVSPSSFDPRPHPRRRIVDTTTPV